MLSSAYWQILPVAINATHTNTLLHLLTGTTSRHIIALHLGRVYMTQRIIVIKDNLIHEELSKSGRLELSLCLWKDGTEITSDWHDQNAHMELKLDFNIMKIVDDMIELHRLWDEKDEVVFHAVSKEMVEIYKRDLQAGIDKLNTIKFEEAVNEADQ
jgi:hypothetical protein